MESVSAANVPWTIQDLEYVKKGLPLEMSKLRISKTLENTSGTHRVKRYTGNFLERILGQY